MIKPTAELDEWLNEKGFTHSLQGDGEVTLRTLLLNGGNIKVEIYIVSTGEQPLEYSVWIRHINTVTHQTTMETVKRITDNEHKSINVLNIKEYINTTIKFYDRSTKNA